MGEEEIATLKLKLAVPEHGLHLGDINFAQCRPGSIISRAYFIWCFTCQRQQFDDHTSARFLSDVQNFLCRIMKINCIACGSFLPNALNEVAPGQFGNSGLFESANIAADHQQFDDGHLMKALRQKKMALCACCHEKPFRRINGASGQTRQLDLS